MPACCIQDTLFSCVRLAWQQRYLAYKICIASSIHAKKASKASGSLSNQIWHTDSANLKAFKQIPEKVIISLDKTWMCPWCYTPAFMKPADHPSPPTKAS